MNPEAITRKGTWFAPVYVVYLTAAAIALWPREAAFGNNLPTNSLKYKEVLHCGPNSLFTFLILSEHPEVTLEQLQSLPVTSDGTSLLALRDAAKQFHVNAEVRHYRPQEIDHMPLPAIAQFKTSSASITPYHFGVIYKIDSSHIYLLNGTTGFKESVRRSRLVAFWTGYVMAEKRSPAAFLIKNWKFLLLLVCLVTVDAAILAVWFHGLKRSGSSEVMTNLEAVA